MSDAPNDSEFVEITTATEPAPGDEAAATETPQQPADGEQQQGDDGEPPKQPEDGEKPDGEDGDEPPLRDDKGRYKGGVQGRIDELTRARREAERQVDYWKGLATRNGAQSGENAAPTSEPNPDDFEDYGEYVKATARWAYADEQRQTAEANAKEAAKSVDTHRSAEWSEKIGAVKATIPDFDAVMDADNTQTSQHVLDAIVDADRGPELLYHLAKHPELVGKLNDMSPNRAAMELGRIEATLAAPAERPKPRDTTQTKAPAPITPVSAGSTTTKDPAKMDQAEYNSWRADQLKRA